MITELLGTKNRAFAGYMVEANESRVYFIFPDDKTLKAIERDGIEGIKNGEIRGGRNCYIYHWEGKGSKALKGLVSLLMGFVDKGGVLAGRRHGKIKKWTPDWWKGAYHG